MMPSVRADSSAITAAGTGITVTLPTHRLNDILLLAVETATGEAVAAPADWTECDDSPQDNGESRLTLFWLRAASAAETNPVIADPGDHVAAAVVVVRNCKTTGDPRNAGSGGTYSAGVGVALTGATTTDPDCLVVMVMSTGRDASSSTTFANWANGSLATVTEVFDGTAANAGGGGIGIATGGKSNIGAYGNTTVDVTGGVGGGYITIALAPAGMRIGAMTENRPYIFISGTEYDGICGSLHITHRVGAESRATFVILDDAGNIELEDHEEVFIATLHAIGSPSKMPLFGGFIESTQIFGWKPDGGRRIRVRCHGYRYLAEKRVVSAVYESMQLSDISAEIEEETHLIDEGVAGADNPGSSVTVDRLEFSYVSLADALDEIGRIAASVSSGAPVHWMIRADLPGNDDVVARDFDMFVIGYRLNSVSVNVSSSHLLWDTLVVERLSPEYRNKVYLTEAKKEEAGKIETQLGDGSRTSFHVGYPIAETPTVEVNTGAGFAAKTVGIKGVDTGKDWYWNQGSEIVTQGSTATVLGSTHSLKVTYTGLVDMVVIAASTSEIATLAQLEGTSGLVERVDSNFQVIGEANGSDLASGRLGRFARRGVRASFDTRSLRYFPMSQLGGTNTVTITEAGISAETMVLEAIEVRDDPANTLSGVRYRPTYVTQDALMPAWEGRLRTPATRLVRSANVVEVASSST